MPTSLIYYKGFTRLEIAAIASIYDVTFFTIIRWIDKGDSRLNTDWTRKAKEAVKEVDKLFLNKI